MMELWDLYTKDRKLVGKTIERGQIIPEGNYHLTVEVWIKNKSGKYLLSQRSKDKSIFPNKWECTCGSALVGENSMQAALREVREELGIELNPEEGRLVNTLILEDFMNDVYLFETNKHIQLAKATCDEVQDAKWMTKSQIEGYYLKDKLRPDVVHFFHDIEPGGNYVYILKCNDHTYYTGWTNHLDKRVEAHNLGKGAKYTKNRRPVELVHYEVFDTKIEAMQREYAIKQLTRKQKEELIQK